MRQSGQARGFGSFEEIFSAFGDIFGMGGRGGGGGGSIFDEFFGGFAQPQAGPRRQRGASLKCQIEIALEEAWKGTERTIEVTRNEHCAECSGSGAAAGSSPVTCPVCRGKGVVTSRKASSIRTTAVATARRVVEHPAAAAAAPAEVKRAHRPPAAWRRLRHPGPPAARASLARGGPRGDLYCVVVVKPHALFQREGTLPPRGPVSYRSVLGTRSGADAAGSTRTPARTRQHRDALRGKGCRACAAAAAATCSCA